MPNKVSRARRAELQHAAHQIRRHGQRAGWPVEQIVAAIQQQLPEILPLEAWRLGFGWSRAQTLDGIAELYAASGLHAPRVTQPMLCRWEHGAHPPSLEYLDALCRLYRTRPDRLGIGTDYTRHPVMGTPSWYAPSIAVAVVPGVQFPAARIEGARTTNGSTPDLPNAQMAAIGESLQLTLGTEGPAGGPQTSQQLDHAVTYYALHYSAQPLALLFAEVQQTRRLVAGILDALDHELHRPRRDQERRHLWQIAGRLSALLGNGAFHLSDEVAAAAHLDTAHQLAVRGGDANLAAWTRGAQSMLAYHRGRFQDAATLARDGVETATTPLVRAQILAWGELRALARLGRRTDAQNVMAQAIQGLEVDADGTAPGRFGFGPTELELHLAEAHVALGQPADAQQHAHASLDHGDYGVGGWAAAELTIALAEAHQTQAGQAAQRGLTVLDRIPFDRLRETTRKRLAALHRVLSAVDLPAARDYRERLHGLPPAQPLPRAGHAG